MSLEERRGLLHAQLGGKLSSSPDTRSPGDRAPAGQRYGPSRCVCVTVGRRTQTGCLTALSVRFVGTCTTALHRHHHPRPGPLPLPKLSARGAPPTRHIPLSPAPGHRVLLPVSRTPAALGAAWKQVPRFVPGTGLFPCGVCKARPSRSQCETPFLFQAGGETRGGVETPFCLCSHPCWTLGFLPLGCERRGREGVVRGCLSLPLGLHPELGSLGHTVISRLIFRVFIVFPVLSSVVF